MPCYSGAELLQAVAVADHVAYALLLSGRTVCDLTFRG